MYYVPIGQLLNHVHAHNGILMLLCTFSIRCSCGVTSIILQITKLILCILFPIAVDVTFNEESFTVSETNGTLDSLIFVNLIGNSELTLTVPISITNGSADLGIY